MRSLNIDEGEGVGLAKSAIETAISNGTLAARDKAGAIDVARKAVSRLRGGVDLDA